MHLKHSSSQIPWNFHSKNPGLWRTSSPLSYIDCTVALEAQRLMPRFEGQIFTLLLKPQIIVVDQIFYLLSFLLKLPGLLTFSGKLPAGQHHYVHFYHTPQGCVLSPLFYVNIILTPLLLFCVFLNLLLLYSKPRLGFHIGILETVIT